MPLQVQFMAQRLQHALPKMLRHTPKSQRALVKRHFDALAATPQGRYALMDYLNFKGEGIDKRERYDGYGWGLLHVLLTMPDVPPQRTLNAFANAAERVIKRRIQHAPVALHEERWLAGWQRRIATYRS